MADRLRSAFNGRDLVALGALLTPDATWGDDPHSPGYCHDRNHIVATYRRLLDGGVSGTMLDTTTGRNGIAGLVEVQWSEDESGHGPRFYQVFLVRDGLIVHIEGHDDKDTALAVISA
jgi:hypothetical protein